MLKKSNIQPQPLIGSRRLAGSVLIAHSTIRYGRVSHGYRPVSKSPSQNPRLWLCEDRATTAQSPLPWLCGGQATTAQNPLHRLCGGEGRVRGPNVFGIDSTLPAQPDVRPAFTLIELLVVMGLIGFLASMLTYALLGAQADARVARTRGTITKLNDVILAQWEEYRYRPVDMRLDSANGPLTARDQAHLRMLILRDTMRMEMPDRVTDLVYTPSAYFSIAGTPKLHKSTYAHKYGTIYQSLASALENSTHGGLIPRTFEQLLRGYESTETLLWPNRVFPTTVVTLNESALNSLHEAVQSSELLYLIVASSQYAGSPALENFRASEIGDSDEDGLLEFIDAWGNAIHWIRWPAGYPSDLNRYSGTDAMDPLKTDWRYSPGLGWQEHQQPQTIVPLIVSRGADEQFGIIFDAEDFFMPGQTPSGTLQRIIYAKMQQGSRYYIDPYFTWDYQNRQANGTQSARPFNETSAPPGVPPRGNQLGAILLQLIDGSDNTFATDNITNHDIILGL
jgi:prepilin-type N-terminal cleavage/methylation domain-containing protein